MIEVLAGLEASYIQAWRNAATVEARENCHRYLRLTEKLIADIKSVATSGQLETARLKELERGKKGFPWPMIG